MSSIYTYDLDAMGAALAATDAFQAWCGASDEEEALECIEWFGSEKQIALPVAILSHGAAWKRELDTLDGVYTTYPQVVVEFIQDCDADDSNRTVFSGLLDSVGAICAELEADNTWIHAHTPDSENTPSRARTGAGQDWASFAVVFDCEIWENPQT